jgi:hypothetical protein
VTVCAKDKEPGVTLDFRTAHASATVKIDLVRCRPHDHGCGPVEYGLGDQIVLPLRGVFVRHLGPRNRVVADPCNALFFRDAEPYRVSHPAHAGDECLVIEPARDVLVDALGERPLERTHTVLDARAIAARLALPSHGSGSCDAARNRRDRARTRREHPLRRWPTSCGAAVGATALAPRGNGRGDEDRACCPSRRELEPERARGARRELAVSARAAFP